MRARTIVLALIVLATAALATLNWGALATPMPISLGIAVVDAPLGLVMLGLTVLLGVLFVAYVLALQGTVLLETRRHAKEMQAQRELADRAEASRFTELRSFIELQNQSAAQSEAALRAALLERIDGLEHTLAARIEQSDNATAAYVGELDDRLRRSA
ncbi:LapA family protein [Ramlibacter sp. H39-3-26]|uniref:LapA family protein n=1 Tax=Curvibacter soli TaxID=3031331 RepID=UPI0023DAE0B7|nr:LapA family protein [Ramlibacter sp. H39-3-26]MDF1485357.1 LapA family protein [Ramlibacter sp. H39-3-26]